MILILKRALSQVRRLFTLETLNDLTPSEMHRLNAAKGCCDLHAFSSAMEELSKISPESQSHPDVLEVRWQVLMNTRQFEAALKVANSLLVLRPEKPVSWTYLTSALLKTGQDEQAYSTLKDACERFPNDEVLHYGLALICCSFQYLGEAKFHLAQAIELGGNAVKLQALEDEGLKPLWDNLGEVEI